MTAAVLACTETSQDSSSGAPCGDSITALSHVFYTSVRLRQRRGATLYCTWILYHLGSLMAVRLFISEGLVTATPWNRLISSLDLPGHSFTCQFYLGAASTSIATTPRTDMMNVGVAQSFGDADCSMEDPFALALNYRYNERTRNLNYCQS